MNGTHHGISLPRAKLVTMQRNPQTESFVIPVIIDAQEPLHGHTSPHPHCNLPSLSFNLTFSIMKLFTRFRKILARLLLLSGKASSAHKHEHNDRFDPPKTSCSSYYSSYSHYNEAISDCIEFFNKSAQDGYLQPRHSDVV